MSTTIYFHCDSSPYENQFLPKSSLKSKEEQHPTLDSTPASLARTLLNPENKFEAKSRRVTQTLGIPKGLKFIDRSPIRLTAAYEKGHAIGEKYIYDRDKRFGVEPGFEAFKRWNSSDDLKLNDPTHHFYEQANRYINNRLTFDLDFQKAKKEIQETQTNINQNEILDKLRNHPILKQTIQRHLVLINRKFHKRHYIKLNYSQPGPDGKVKIPFYRAKAPRIFGSLGKLLHQYSTVSTPREKNFGAVTEAIANDIFSTLELGGQKLKLIQAYYPDGSIKLLLDGTEVSGPNGEKFLTLEGQIKQGYLDGNEVVGADGQRYPFDDCDLGRHKIKALLLGDRDKVGTTGGNIGFVIVNGKARLMNIDPGKSLDLPQNLTQDDRPKRKSFSSFAHFLLSKIFFEVKLFLIGSTNLMTQVNLRTNLSFEQPNCTLLDKARGGYHNYSIFDDANLSEKMEGMRTILKNWNQVEHIFDCYIKEFSKPGALDFRSDLLLMKKYLVDRKNYFIKVLAERLALNNEQLDFLEHIEKLTSHTYNQIQTKNGPIRFHHLQVFPQNRKEWHLRKIQENTAATQSTSQSNGHQYELYYDASSVQDAHKMGKKIKHYQRAHLKSQGQLLPLHPKIVSQRVIIEINDEKQMKELMEGFSETKIADYKHQPLRKVIRP
jgi:hypothetical protein